MTSHCLAFDVLVGAGVFLHGQRRRTLPFLGPLLYPVMLHFAEADKIVHTKIRLQQLPTKATRRLSYKVQSVMFGLVVIISVYLEKRTQRNRKTEHSSSHDGDQKRSRIPQIGSYNRSQDGHAEEYGDFIGQTRENCHNTSESQGIKAYGR